MRPSLGAPANRVARFGYFVAEWLFLKAILYPNGYLVGYFIAKLKLLWAIYEGVVMAVLKRI